MELLHGKAKEEFEKWYFKNHVKANKAFSKLLPHEYYDIFGWLYGSCNTIKNAFIIEWFDSVGYTIDKNTYERKMIITNWIDSEQEKTSIDCDFMEIRNNSFSEWYVEAIKKAVEIFNEKHI